MEGEYTIVKVRLPALDYEELEQVETKNVAIEQRLDGLSLLYVDDEDLSRLPLTKILQGLGAEVTDMDNGKKAWNYYKKYCNSVDIVLVDLNMPKMNGAQLIAKMHKLKPAQKIIIISGHIDEFDIHKEIPAIRKPIQVHSLVAKLHEIWNA